MIMMMITILTMMIILIIILSILIFCSTEQIQICTNTDTNASSNRNSGSTVICAKSFLQRTNTARNTLTNTVTDVNHGTTTQFVQFSPARPAGGKNKAEIWQKKQEQSSNYSSPAINQHFWIKWTIVKILVKWSSKNVEVYKIQDIKNIEVYKNIPKYSNPAITLFTQIIRRL